MGARRRRVGASDKRVGSSQPKGNERMVRTHTAGCPLHVKYQADHPKALACEDIEGFPVPADWQASEPEKITETQSRPATGVRSRKKPVETNSRANEYGDVSMDKNQVVAFAGGELPFFALRANRHVKASDKPEAEKFYFNIVGEDKAFPHSYDAVINFSGAIARACDPDGHVQEGDGMDMWLFSEGIERVTVRYEGVDYTLVEDGE